MIEIIHEAIRKSLASADGAGSDLEQHEVVDETWVYVQGDIDTHNLAADIELAIKLGHS